MLHQQFVDSQSLLVWDLASGRDPSDAVLVPVDTYCRLHLAWVVAIGEKRIFNKTIQREWENLHCIQDEWVQVVLDSCQVVADSLALAAVAVVLAVADSPAWAAPDSQEWVAVVAAVPVAVGSLLLVAEQHQTVPAAVPPTAVRLGRLPAPVAHRMHL